ncbi:hypothetical protein CC85DRAFT_324897 [Cutaneotrichosporon oleaginosum]|uniref:Smr domain-containing protein n=1 Tax=Cutaneotrichosporon oleaginosum TaxID=879819 RepID=A0A0J0XYG2_9TREE|nr:uncharacterized protein CC85DRAFT_324897 [Cutaneotrichosporon oleaginosum]KLT46083.1 hypothetical protein CC85DRAFT_324897 [Cutaneotrichosporon oleaginosum]TXT10096.1 hypothetical protein COLE_04030 [Cutaneotrichosporon oleaginosum]
MGKRQKQRKKAEATQPVPSPPWQPSTADVIDASVLESVLHADFPLLDSALVNAMVQDYARDGTLGANESVLREQLAALEAQMVADAADEGTLESAKEVTDEPDSLPIDGLSLHSSRSGAHLPPSSFPSLPSRPSSSASASRSTAKTESDDLASEREFLAALFPHLSSQDINAALATEHSLDDAVDHLLSIEAIRESQRNGTWGDDDESVERDGWEVVPSRRSSVSSTEPSARAPAGAAGAAVPITRGKKKGKKTIPIVDTLQRRPQLSPIARPPPGNVWDALSRLASYLAEVAPRAHAPWFQTYLHSPEYACTHDAVRAALQQLALSGDAPPPEVVDILAPIFGADDALMHCIAAADGDMSNAIDLIDLLDGLRTWDDYEAARGARDPYDVLRGLERRSARASANPSVGANASASASASPSPSVVPSPASSRPATPAAIPASTPATVPASTRALNPNRLTRPAPKETAPLPARAVPGSVAAATGYRPTHELLQPSNSTWSAAHVAPAQARRAGSPAPKWSAKGKKRAAANIMPGNIGLGLVMRPVDAPKASGGSSNANANATPAAASASRPPSAAARHFARADEWYERRKHAMHRATADYNAAPKHLRGQVIGAYRLQAREAAAEAQRHTLAGARAVLEEQRAADPNSIDLHLRTVAESTTLALEAVEEWYAKGGRGHFQIITGKGLHSAGQRGVLGPAVYNALHGAGWRVEAHPGYLTVKGR